MIGFKLAVDGQLSGAKLTHLLTLSFVGHDPTAETAGRIRAVRQAMGI
jgi:hypothetical protein